MADQRRYRPRTAAAPTASISPISNTSAHSESVGIGVLVVGPGPLEPPEQLPVDVTGFDQLVNWPSFVTLVKPSCPAAPKAITWLNPVPSNGVCSGGSGGGPGATSTAVVSSLNPSLVGQSVTFTATVTGTTPTGTVQFRDGVANLGSPVALAGGSASLVTSALSAGTHAITAVYSGDADDATSTSPPVSQVVNTGGVQAAAPIPTLTEWGLTVLVLLVAAFGILLRRRW